MTKFDLTSYLKPTPSQPASANELPEWYFDVTETVKQAYHEVVKEFENIQSKIASGEALKVNQRRIVSAQIADKVSADKSLFSERRNPDFYKFLFYCNTKLEKLWIAGESKNKGVSLSKKQLERELTKTKRLLKEERDKNYSEAITEALKSELLGSSNKLANKCKDLEAEIAQLRETNSILKSRLRGYTISSVG